jgi:hypothetical protein
MSGARKAVPEDLEFDPAYRRQRRLAGHLLGIAINALGGGQSVFTKRPEPKELARQLRELALDHGIVAFDEWHHAPACPANNWSKMALPEGPCTCGAAARKIR